MGVLVPPAIGVESTLIGGKSTQQVPEELEEDERFSTPEHHIETGVGSFKENLEIRE